MSTANPIQRQFVLTFRLADQEYGVPVEDIVQIIEMVTITRLPQVSTFVKGIINYGGQLVPILDMRTYMDLSPRPYGLHTPIILVNADRWILGLVVDVVDKVLELPSKDIPRSDAVLARRLLDQNATSFQEPYLSAIAIVDRRIVPIIEISALLTNRQEAQLARIIPEKRAAGATA